MDAAAVLGLLRIRIDDGELLFISRGRRVPYRHLGQRRPGAVLN
jgi:hypothetical protein